MLRIDPSSSVPIWNQIEEGVRRLVGAGTLRPGAALVSVRDLARELRVNPMTVSKAYQRLADDGVVEVRRGEGTFVAAGASRVPRAERMRDLRAATDRYVSLAASLGASRDDVLREVAAAWTRNRDGGAQ